MYEFFHEYTYSMTVAPGSKTIWVGSTISNTITQNDPNKPSELCLYNDTHKYVDNDGTHLEQAMTDPTGPILVGPRTSSKNASADQYFKGANGLTGIATISDVFMCGDGAGLVGTFPSGIPPSNSEIDVAIGN
jgi:hypothetical protein